MNRQENIQGWLDNMICKIISQNMCFKCFLNFGSVTLISKGSNIQFQMGMPTNQKLLYINLCLP